MGLIGMKKTIKNIESFFVKKNGSRKREYRHSSLTTGRGACHSSRREANPNMCMAKWVCGLFELAEGEKMWTPPQHMNVSFIGHSQRQCTIFSSALFPAEGCFSGASGTQATSKCTRVVFHRIAAANNMAPATWMLFPMVVRKIADAVRQSQYRQNTLFTEHHPKLAVGFSESVKHQKNNILRGKKYWQTQTNVQKSQCVRILILPFIKNICKSGRKGGRQLVKWKMYITSMMQKWVSLS